MTAGALNPGSRACTSLPVSHLPSPRFQIIIVFKTLSIYGTVVLGSAWILSHVAFNLTNIPQVLKHLPVGCFHVLRFSVLKMGTFY